MLRWGALGCAIAIGGAFWTVATAVAAGPSANFDGPFLGLHTDYGFGAQSDWCGCGYATLVTDAIGGDGGLVLGTQAGIDWRFGTFVIGAGVRASYANLGFDQACTGLGRCDGALTWLGEAQVSAGLVVFGDVLLAASAGLAAGDVSVTGASGDHRASALHDGNAFALRVEQAMSDGWRFGLEYRYYEMGGTNQFDLPTGGTADVEISWTAQVVGLTMANEF